MVDFFSLSNVAYSIECYTQIQWRTPKSHQRFGN